MGQIIRSNDVVGQVVPESCNNMGVFLPRQQIPCQGLQYNTQFCNAHNVCQLAESEARDHGKGSGNITLKADLSSRPLLILIFYQHIFTEGSK